MVFCYSGGEGTKRVTRGKRPEEQQEKEIHTAQKRDRLWGREKKRIVSYFTATGNIVEERKKEGNRHIRTKDARHLGVLKRGLSLCLFF